LARLDKENLQAGARVELGEKRNATDFALWKFSPAEAQRDMEWESPWVGPYGNKGFPGWHIECSAMSRELLGDTFDIHTGGIDHIPVHHTNEIAQSVPLCGCGSKSKSHVDFWVHNEFVVLQDEAKMSKSSGNFLTVCGLKERGFHPLALRYLYLQTHYRKSVKFDFDILAQAQTALKRLWLKVVELEQVEPAATDLADSFVDAFATDLDTASVLGLLHGSLKNDDPAAQKYNLLLADQVLGLDFAHAQQRLDELAALSAVGEVPAEIAELLAQRVAAKAARDFATADALRDQIQAAGYKVVDTAGGAKLERL